MVVPVANVDFRYNFSNEQEEIKMPSLKEISFKQYLVLFKQTECQA